MPCLLLLVVASPTSGYAERATVLIVGPWPGFWPQHPSYIATPTATLSPPKLVSLHLPPDTAVKDADIVMAALTEQFVQLSLDEDRNKVLPPTPPSNTAHTPAHSVSSSRPHPYKLQHSRAGSSSSIASILYSEPGTPSRLPQRSSLRRQGSVAGHSRSNSV